MTESLAEEFRKRQAVKPDQWTLKWWNDQFEQVAKGYRGATHAMNLVLAEVEDRDSILNGLRARAEVQDDILHEATVAIGKLQAEVTELKEAMQKSRDAYSELKKKLPS